MREKSGSPGKLKYSIKTQGRHTNKTFAHLSTPTVQLLPPPGSFSRAGLLPCLPQAPADSHVYVRYIGPSLPSFLYPCATLTERAIPQWRWSCKIAEDPGKPHCFVASLFPKRLSALLTNVRGGWRQSTSWPLSMPAWDIDSDDKGQFPVYLFTVPEFQLFFQRAFFP